MRWAPSARPAWRRLAGARRRAPQAGRGWAGWRAAPAGSGQGSGLAVDKLSGLFLVMALGAAVPVSVAFASWAAGPGSAGPQPMATRMLAQGYALALRARAVTVSGQDAFTGLVGWEVVD